MPNALHSFPPIEKAAGDRNRRLLVIDDNRAIHDDVRKILCPTVNAAAASIDELETELLGTTAPRTRRDCMGFEVDSAYQGREGLTLLQQAVAAGRPYAMALVDVRMPPGWDGVETAAELWRVQPDLQIVICTAYSDYTWDDMLDHLGCSDRLVILRKPFDSIELLQLASCLTEKWSLMQQTRRYAEDLEARVRARTADLEAANQALQAEIGRRAAIEADLVRAKEAAESADRAKSTFLANMSHEIRTPMNGVIGMANLLLSSELTTEQRDFANTISHCCDSLLTIINDILDLSKIEAGRLELEDIEFNVAETVQFAVNLQTELAGRKSLSLDLKLDDSVPPILRGDPMRLRQVLLNLIANAVKFTDHGGVTVRVSSAAEADAAERGSTGVAVLRVEVSDTGPGISPEAQSQLFQPFVQADASTTRRYGGTGLGLAICKRIVELMGGEIGLNSVPGQGSTFWFTVRLADVSSESGAPSLRVIEEPPVSAVMPGHAPPILVAEDNAVNQKVISLILRNLGYECRVVASGRAALQALQQKRYSLVLMDEHMPEMDGITATREIRRAAAMGRLPLNPTIPIIATTADAMKETRERCLAAGMNEFLPKPLRADALAAVIASALPVDDANLASA